MLLGGTSLGVVMCTYNGERYVMEQLDSIAGQTRLPDSLVVVDDSSADSTVSLLRAFARKASFPVEVFVNERTLGFIKNFEKGIRLCTADVILPSDQDDVWLPGKTERIEAAFSRSPNVGVVFTNAWLVDENLHPLGRSLWDSIGFSSRERRAAHRRGLFETLMKRNLGWGATMAFRGQYRDVILPFPECWGHDQWAAMVIAGIADGDLIDECLSQYRQHAGSVCGAPTKTFASEARAARSLWRTWPSSQIPSYRVLREALQRLSPTPDRALCVLDDKIRHLEARSSLPDSWLGRPKTVLTELLARRYHRFSRGLLSAGVDLMPRR